MISRYRVSLNGTELDSLSSEILIRDVAYTPIEPQVNKQTTADLDGLEVSGGTVEKQTITVTFEIDAYSTKERNKICQKVNAWAQNGGTLKINDREGQYLTVRCARLASIQSALKWTDPLRLIFESTVIPYFQSNTEKTVTITGTNVSGNLVLDGNTKQALVSVEVTAAAAITALKLTVGNTTLDIGNLSLATGQKLVVDYLKNRYLRIRENGSSANSKLNGSSNDNLKADCGKTTAVRLIANGRATAKFTARGLWL